MVDPAQLPPSPDMLALARAAMARAYAPYSGFTVGAAEASAIAALIMAGQRRIVEVPVIGKGPALVSPCGGCRQRLHEFADDTTPVHICDPEGLRRAVSLGPDLSGSTPLDLRSNVC